MDTLKLSGNMIEIPTNKSLQSKVDLPDYANDSKASNYINHNHSSSTKTLQKAILSQANNTTFNSFCSISGIGFVVETAIELKDLTPSVCLPLSSLLTLAKTSSRESLYKLPMNVLAGLVLTVFTNKDLLRTKDTNTLLTNSILATAGRTNLVESVILYNLVIANGIDSDTLPKLDITLATHNEGIANFEQPLAEYISNLSYCITEQTASEAQRRETLRREREEQAIQARQKQEARKNKSLDSTYEAKRKLAYSALKDATIDLYHLKFKKLVDVINLLVSKTGSSVKEEIKAKVIVRLDEILASVNHDNNKDLVANIYTIKDFVKLSMSERVINKVDSSLERARDIKTEDELQSTNKKLTLKEKLALAKERLNATANKEGTV